MHSFTLQNTKVSHRGRGDTPSPIACKRARVRSLRSYAKFVVNGPPPPHLWRWIHAHWWHRMATDRIFERPVRLSRFRPVPHVRSGFRPLENYGECGCLAIWFFKAGVFSKLSILYNFTQPSYYAAPILTSYLVAWCLDLWRQASRPTLTWQRYDKSS